MKLRCAVLIVCMVAVPLTAMFSHKIPRDWRRQAWWAARFQAPSTPAERAADGPGLVPVAATAVATNETPLDGDPPALADTARVSERRLPPAPATVRPPEHGATTPTSVESQLQALGAVSIECVPVPGGLHRCSCRVAADPSGQLQRVFQTTNADPNTALRNLLGQVQFWKHRTATRPTPSARSMNTPAVDGAVLR